MQTPSAGNRGGGNRFLGWLNANRWFTAMIVINIIALLVCIILPPFLLIWGTYMIIGIPVAIFLFIPRQHLIKRVRDSLGGAANQVAGAGLGGVLLMIGFIFTRVMRAANRAQRNENLDFSGMTDPFFLGQLVGSLLGIAFFLGLFLFLWHWMGIARVIALGYMSGYTILLLAGFIGGMSDRNPSRSFRGRPGMVRPNVPPSPFPGGAPPMFTPRTPRAVSPDQFCITIANPGSANIDGLQTQVLERLGNPPHVVERSGTDVHLIIEDSREFHQLLPQLSSFRILSFAPGERNVLIAPLPKF